MRACFAILLLMAVCWAQGSTNATGGEITAANLSFTQSLSQWYFFYSSTAPSSSSTIYLTDSGVGASGNSSRPIQLPGTSGFYLISDSSSPFDADLESANLTLFDSHFNLSSVESSSKIFNETSNFSIQTGVSTPGGTLELPTLYIPGQGSDRAFRVGLAQAGSNFIFVVPRQQATGLDGQTYDFQFFLPYAGTGSYGSATYFVFSIVEPTPSTGGTVYTPALDYSWTYDGKTFTISSEPSTSVSMADVLGKATNGITDASGQAKLTVLPGYYVLHLSKSGYRDLTDTLYLSPGPATPANETALPPGQTPGEPAPEVTVTRSIEGVTVCLGGDCYFQAASDADAALLLSDLSCTGSLCQLVNISPATFVAKHGMRRVLAPATTPAAPGGPLNVSSLMASLGRGLSERLGGSPGSSPADLAAMTVAALGAGLLVFWGSKAWFAGKMPPKGGYG